jgi:hypothetical protein
MLVVRSNSSPFGETKHWNLWDYLSIKTNSCSSYSWKYSNFSNDAKIIQFKQGLLSQLTLNVDFSIRIFCVNEKKI